MKYLLLFVLFTGDADFPRDVSMSTHDTLDACQAKAYALATLTDKGHGSAWECEAIKARVSNYP